MYLLESVVIPSSGLSNPGGGLSNVGNLVDRKPSTIATLTQTNPTIQIDLGASKAVGLVRVTSNDLSAPDTIEVKSSSDGATFGNSESFIAPGLLRVEQRSRRYWQLEISASIGDTIVEIALFEVLGDYETAEKDMSNGLSFTVCPFRLRDSRKGQTV